MNYNDYLEKVGLKVYDTFTQLKSNVYGAKRVYTGASPNIRFIVLHTTTGTARDNSLDIRNNDRVESYHAIAGADGVYQTIMFKHVAHHAGSKDWNMNSLGFELSTVDIDQGYKNYVKYIGWVLYQLGLTPSNDTVRYHHNNVSTGCGGYFKQIGKAKVLEDIWYYYNIAKTGYTPKPKPKPQLNEIGEPFFVGQRVAFSTIYDDSLGTNPKHPYYTEAVRPHGQVGVMYIRKIFAGSKNQIANYGLSRTRNGEILGFTRGVNIYKIL